MKPRVYVETTVLGYLTSWPSGDLIVAGRQKITHDWWRFATNTFELVVSELVHREAGRGDPQAIRDRMEAIKGLAILPISEAAKELAASLVAKGAVPFNQAEDAIHIAIAVVNGIDYLVTWNFKHIANAVTRSGIEDACIEAGYESCMICTPEELWEPGDNV